MKNTFTLFVLLVLITSCSHTYYVQTTQIVPLFKEKNETQATISYGTTDETNTIDIQAAHSFTNKFAMTTNVMFVSGGDDVDGGKGQYFDVALGYFKPLSPHGVFEIYGGVGGSNQKHQYAYEGGYADLSFKKVFIQPSIGLTYSAFDIALTSGFSNINFDYINNQINPNTRDFDNIEQIGKNRNYFLFEPSLTIRGGWRFVKLQGQLGLSQNLSSTSSYYFEPLKLNIGLTLAFAERYRNITRGNSK